jgi:hypothetical protein
MEILMERIVPRTKPSVYAGFTNVWLQDSTSLHLPDTLIKKYKGNKSKGEPKSVAKLNVIMNVLNGVCPILELKSFTVAEQSLSPNILKIARAGDLVIRDMGYFVMNVFGKLKQEGVYFLSRLKYNAYLFDIDTGHRINLLKYLAGEEYLDIDIICGKEQPLKVRLVAVKISAQQAAERRRKAKKDKQKGINHSKEYYGLLDYALFITTVERDRWDFKQVAEAYRIRWNIEILFKSWKTGLSLEALIPPAKVKTERVESVLYLALIYITLFQTIIWNPLRWLALKIKRELSIIKTTRWALNNPLCWIHNGLTPQMKKEIFFQCCYETRARTNATQHLAQFLSLT